MHTPGNYLLAKQTPLYFEQANFAVSIHRRFQLNSERILAGKYSTAQRVVATVVVVVVAVGGATREYKPVMAAANEQIISCCPFMRRRVTRFADMENPFQTWTRFTFPRGGGAW